MSLNHSSERVFGNGATKSAIFHRIDITGFIVIHKILLGNNEVTIDSCIDSGHQQETIGPRYSNIVL